MFPLCGKSCQKSALSVVKKHRLTCSSEQQITVLKMEKYLDNSGFCFVFSILFLFLWFNILISNNIVLTKHIWKTKQKQIVKLSLKYPSQFINWFPGSTLTCCTYHSLCVHSFSVQWRTIITFPFTSIYSGWYNLALPFSLSGFVVAVSPCSYCWVQCHHEMTMKARPKF